MRDHLGSIDHEQRAIAMREFGQFMDWVDDSGDIRDAGDGHIVDPLTMLLECVFDGLNADAAHRRGSRFCRNVDDMLKVFAVRQVIGVMFHDRRDDDIAPGSLCAQGLGDPVDTGRRSIPSEKSRV